MSKYYHEELPLGWRRRLWNWLLGREEYAFISGPSREEEHRRFIEALRAPDPNYNPSLPRIFEGELGRFNAVRFVGEPASAEATGKLSGKGFAFEGEEL